MSELLELGGVAVADVEARLLDLHRSSPASFGDGSGGWVAVESFGWHYGSVLGCLRELERLGRARPRPETVDYWQPC